jgi:anaerobic selenocysteine-containing dehydrogenase
VRVEGDPEFPLNRGRLCPRCAVLPEVVYHPDRLKHPLKRAGERGEGRWQRITWDEALEAIAFRLEQIKDQSGAESVVFCQGTGRDVISYHSRLAYSFGSRNKVIFGPLHGNACFFPKMTTMAALFGNLAVADCAQAYPERYDHPEWRAPKCMIIWGNEPIATSPDGFLGQWVIDCMKQGTELIVVDPRRTWPAARARHWLQIRPGTDAALAMGMLHVIINEHLYNTAFVEQWTHGFDELKDRVQAYPPRVAAEITWISPEEIVKAARYYAESKPASVQWGVALDHSKECLPTLQAITSLMAITGNLDAPGGNMIRGQLFGMGHLFDWGLDLLSEEQRQKKVGLGRYPLIDWMEFVPGEALIDQMLTEEPYPIRAAWIQSTNTIACGVADPRRTYEAFKKLDLNVVVDLFMTPTAMAFADYVLPAATYPERDGVYLPLGGVTCTGTINRAIEPLGECRSDMEINLEMGRRLNPGAWPWENVHEMFDAMLAGAHVTFEELRELGYLFDEFQYRKHEKGWLRPDGEPGFDTPTGKVELYSTVFERCGLDPLPYYEEPPESPMSTPEVAEVYPLVLTTGARVQGYFHSEHRQIPSLRRMNPYPVTEIHPLTAAALGIEDGDWIILENRYGRCRQRAKLTEGIDPRVVSAQHGWWFPEKEGPEPSLFGAWDSNINLLLPSGWTGRSGLGYPFKSQMCRIRRADWE